MNLKKQIVSTLCLFMAFLGYAQDCTLGINGKDAQTIISVFQLNDGQVYKMTNWGAELDDKTKLLQDKIEALLKEHPQETNAELAKLALKHNNILSEIVDLSKAYDKKLIAVFNDKQRERYTLLCKEAMRKPLLVTPKIIRE
ncbi:MAG: hypothetical protein V3U92_18745 [Cellulophaga sp.]